MEGRQQLLFTKEQLKHLKEVSRQDEEDGSTKRDLGLLTNIMPEQKQKKENQRALEFYIVTL